MRGAKFPERASKIFCAKAMSGRHRNKGTTMLPIKNCTRISVALLVAAIVLDARAQFRLPKMPGNIPGPKLPFGGNRGAGPSQQELLNSGKNLADWADLDNPSRQDELGQSIAVSISNRYPVVKD